MRNQPGFGHAGRRAAPRHPLPALCLALACAAQAGGTESPLPLLEEVATTASKKGVAEAAQDIAGAVSVLDGARLDALPVDDIKDLGYALPNVA